MRISDTTLVYIGLKDLCGNILGFVGQKSMLHFFTKRSLPPPPPSHEVGLSCPPPTPKLAAVLQPLPLPN